MFKFAKTKKRKKWTVKLKPDTASSNRAVLWGYNAEEVVQLLGLSLRTFYRLRKQLNIETLYLEDVLALKNYLDLGTTEPFKKQG